MGGTIFLGRNSSESLPSAGTTYATCLSASYPGGHAFRPPGSHQQVTSAKGTGCDLPALTATPRPLLRIPPDPARQTLPFLSNEDESHLQKLTSTKPFPRTRCAPDTGLSAFNVFSLNFTKALG